MTHSVVIHALMVSWYHMKRSSNPIGDVIMDLDPWRSPGVVDMVEEAQEALGPKFDSLMVLVSLKVMMWSLMTLMPLVWSWSPLLALDMVRWHDEGTHTHMMVI